MSAPELVDMLLASGGEASRATTAVLRHAVVTGYSPGNRVRIMIGGGEVHASSRLHGYAPAAGKEVLVLQQGYELVVLGPASSESGGLGTGSGPSTPVNTDAFLDKHTAARQTMAAPLQIDNPSGLTLHYPGNSVINLGVINSAGKNSLNVTSGSDQSGALAPVRAGSPVTEEHLARVDWVRNTMTMQMSGPHGPLGSWQSVPATGAWTPYQNGAVVSAARWDDGMIRVTAACDLWISGVTSGTASIYFAPLAKWASGAALTWHNGTVENIARLTVSAAAGQGRVGACATGWLDNRPGDRLVYSGAAWRTDTTATSFTFGGSYRLSHQFYPYANRVDAGLSEGWRVY